MQIPHYLYKKHDDFARDRSLGLPKRNKYGIFVAVINDPTDPQLHLRVSLLTLQGQEWMQHITVEKTGAIDPTLYVLRAGEEILRRARMHELNLSNHELIDLYRLGPKLFDQGQIEHIKILEKITKYLRPSNDDVREMLCSPPSSLCM